MNNIINSTNQNNTTFKSRIIFLSPKGFSKVKQKYKNKKFENICHFSFTKNEQDWDSCYKTNIKRGTTQGVRTCTAGVCANKGKKASLFWHIENTLNNIKQYPMLEPFINGTNAIIIGSKKNYENSYELFEKFVQTTASKKIPTTIIKGTKKSEADLFYESKEDTMYICMRNIYENDNYVRSMQDLQNTCDVVEISPTDSIEFLDCLPKYTLKQKLNHFFKNIFRNS